MVTRPISLDLIDPSPFQAREKSEPLQTAQGLGIIQPPVVRPKGSRFEVVCGHRRVASAKALGFKEIVCEVRELGDEEAARLSFTENQDRENFSDYERGRFFQAYMEKFSLSEREADKRLGVSDTTIHLCLGVVRMRESVLRPLSKLSTSLYESAVTGTKMAAVSSLPEGEKVKVLGQVVEEKLSTNETASLVAKVRSGKDVGRATSEVLVRREERRVEAYHNRKKAGNNGSRRAGVTRLVCGVCGDSLTVRHLPSGQHRILKSEKS